MYRRIFLSQFCFSYICFILIRNISILSFCSRTAVRFNWFRVHSEHIIHIGPRRVLEVWSFWVLPEKFQTSSHQWHTMQHQASFNQRSGQWLQNLQMRWVWFFKRFYQRIFGIFLKPLISNYFYQRVFCIFLEHSGADNVFCGLLYFCKYKLVLFLIIKYTDLHF